MSHHYSGPDFGFPQGDGRLDFCDLYAFRKPGDANRSIFVIDVHPSTGMKPQGPTTPEPFAPEAIYELKIDTDGDVVADIAYRFDSRRRRTGRRARRSAAPRASMPAGSATAGQRSSRVLRCREARKRR
jgi:hypothetical protein